MDATTLDYTPKAIVRRLFPEHGEEVQVEQKFSVLAQGQQKPPVTFCFSHMTPNGNWHMHITPAMGSDICVVRHGDYFEIYVLSNRLSVLPLSHIETVLRTSPDPIYCAVYAVLGRGA